MHSTKGCHAFFTGHAHFRFEETTQSVRVSLILHVAFGRNQTDRGHGRKDAYRARTTKERYTFARELVFIPQPSPLEGLAIKAEPESGNSSEGSQYPNGKKRS